MFLLLFIIGIICLVILCISWVKYSRMKEERQKFDYNTYSDLRNFLERNFTLEMKEELKNKLIKIYNKISDWNDEDYIPSCSIPLVIISASFIVISILGSMIIIPPIIESYVAPAKIEMYQEQNDKIENDIKCQVENYMQYESKTFKEVKKEDAMNLVQLYPQLKADELVKSQMQLHIDNINKINKLKELIINANINRFWVYFGGNFNG